MIFVRYMFSIIETIQLMPMMFVECEKLFYCLPIDLLNLLGRYVFISQIIFFPTV